MSSSPPNNQTWQTWQQGKAWSTPTTNATGPTGLWRNPGVDDNLNYIEEAPIHEDYTDYKQKQAAAGVASKSYSDYAALLVALKPYSNPKPKRAGNRMYYENEHKRLEPLATGAANAAGE